ncbi:LSm family protein [Lacticaseibacillus yichunensis]|uniref:DUF2187 domain-containing protein n=1 Tax=Lacticaseibacillus yichunensis TaxID=2486015 RepID=A0ABW4CNR5_9LACO|nr:hypothetical protein [Lacticaseibacillus yichunensis]
MEKLNKNYFGLAVEITTTDGKRYEGVVSDVISAANNSEDGEDALTMPVNGFDTYFPVSEIQSIKEAD